MLEIYIDIYMIYIIYIIMLIYTQKKIQRVLLDVNIL